MSADRPPTPDVYTEIRTLIATEFSPERRVLVTMARMQATRTWFCVRMEEVTVGRPS
jgi:hypothetical protein